MCASFQLVSSNIVHLAGDSARDLKLARALNLHKVEVAWNVRVKQLAGRVACLGILDLLVYRPLEMK